MDHKDRPIENVAGLSLPRKFIFWAAAASTLWGVLYLLGLLGKIIVDGSLHSVSSQPIQNVSAVIAILWNLSLLILFVAFDQQSTGREALFSRLGLVFMILVCGLSSISWFVQLAVVPKLAANSDLTNLVFLDINDNLSITYAMEHLGWGLFFGLALLFAAFAMKTTNLESWIKGSFLAGAGLSLLHVIGVAISDVAMSDLGFIAWGIVLPLSTGLMAIQSRKS